MYVKTFKTKILKLSKLAFTTENYRDTISLQPPNSLNSRSSREQKSHQWVSKFLHNSAWESWDCSYSYLLQIVQTIVVRFPLSMFYAHGTEKSKTLRKILEKQVINLVELLFPKIENSNFYK